MLPQEEAEVLSVAMNHKSMELPGITLSDPYFTEEQWKLVVSQKHSLLDEAGDLMKILRNQDELYCNPRCACAPRVNLLLIS